ncbi:MAG: type I phosphomannose isomerase catalytic subunit [Chlamydiota bacterium]
MGSRSSFFQTGQKKLAYFLWSIPLHRLKKGRFCALIARAFWKSGSQSLTDLVFLRASHLTFYTIMSMVPLLAILFALATGFGAENLLEDFLYERFQNHLTFIETLMGFARNLLQETKGGLLAGVSLLVLFWTVFNVLHQVESSFNHIWRVKTGRNWIRKCTDYATFLCTVPFLFVLSNSLRIYLITRGTAAFFLENIAYFGLPYLLMWIVFTLFYVWIPNVLVKASCAIWSGAISAAIYQIIEWFYLFFQIGVSRYNAIYGSFAALPLFFTSIYIGWLIVLWGGELTYSLETLQRYDGNLDSSPLSTKGKRYLLLWMLSVSWRQFTSNNAPITKKEIFSRVRFSPKIVEELIEELVEKGWWVPAQYQGEDGYVLVKNVGDYSLKHVIDLLEGAGKWPVIVEEEGHYLASHLEKLEREMLQVKTNIKVGDLPMKKNYPIYFYPVYKDYVWGGVKIKELGGREKIPFSRVAESWEIADHKDGMSVVENGPYKGLTLSELTHKCGKALLGEKGGKFPLLIKILDARESLSVQVHPNEKTAPTLKGEPKTEMWYVLQAEKNAGVCVGFREKMTPEKFAKAARDNTLIPLLQSSSVQPGDTIFVPGGTIHAILHGALILEVQQNSNTTYRIYDWNRGRKLHLSEATKALSWEKTESIVEQKIHNKDHLLLHRSEHFCMEKWDEGLKKEGPFTSFQIIFLLKGEGSITVDGNTCALQPFRACLIPAASEQLLITVEKGSSYLRIYLPSSS